MKQLITRLAALGAAALFTLTATAADKTEASESQPAATQLEVHKSPSCGCCGGWVDHIKEAGFAAQVNNTREMMEVKQKLGIEPAYQSCHTAVSEDGGYFFEGHVPAAVITQFLNEAPVDAVGLAVPGMPIGSPGMEMGNRFDAYDVLQINWDGSVEVYATINQASEQFSDAP